MRILIVGDLIIDRYRICRMKGNLCQEMPLPQLEMQDEYESRGGAGLVADNLRSLIGDNSSVRELFGTVSFKERIGIAPFNQWVCRIDRDAGPLEDKLIADFGDVACAAISAQDLVIVSDYGKHSLNFKLAREIVAECENYSVPLFVDARHHWDWYIGAFAAFPNNSEYRPGMKEYFKHVIHKAGADGCYVDGEHFTSLNRPGHPVDTCGAGDVFLAAFAYRYLKTKDLAKAATFANYAAGISVHHWGTYVLDPILEGVL